MVGVLFVEATLEIVASMHPGAHPAERIYGLPRAPRDGHEATMRRSYPPSTIELLFEDISGAFGMRLLSENLQFWLELALFPPLKRPPLLALADHSYTTREAGWGSASPFEAKFARLLTSNRSTSSDGAFYDLGGRPFVLVSACMALFGVLLLFQLCPWHSGIYLEKEWDSTSVSGSYGTSLLLFVA